MLYVHELLVMPQIQRWKQQIPSLFEVCSSLSICCEQLCVLCCRMLTVASGDCAGPHVAFMLLKAFHVPAASAPNVNFMHPSLQSFFLASLCGWLELDPLDISYSLSSMPDSLVDTVMRLMHNEENSIPGITNTYKSRSTSLSQQTLCQSLLNFYLLPSNMQVCQRWQVLLSSAQVSCFYCVFN